MLDWLLNNFRLKPDKLSILIPLVILFLYWIVNMYHVYTGKVNIYYNMNWKNVYSFGVMIFSLVIAALLWSILLYLVRFKFTAGGLSGFMELG